MSPFAGEGANLAMHDAARLACELCGTGVARWRLGGAGLPSALRRYEAGQACSARAAAAESAANMEVAFSAATPAAFAALMEEKSTLVGLLRAGARRARGRLTRDSGEGRDAG
jgi:2-polyprenyl-6-methoxyphenol hydroxylase-like FAD-dependent oxidoreductase